MSYDFSTLNDKDLEELSRDVLSKKINVDFQSFKPGSDGGIDLRYASNNDENEIIVQVKHYLNSGISKLKSDLKKIEIPKIKALEPRRYILVTSLPLSPANKEEIKGILAPYVISTADILGKSDLNNVLRNYPEIETAHFKLWLSSTNVLNRILHNSINGRSEFYKEKIKARLRIFVPNKTHHDAVQMLNKYHFILITGAPGIGKSTLADMLTYQLLATDFELVYVREIKEAEDLYQDNKKQIFYFDDFLGAITLDLKSSRNVDSAIINFIERIKSDKTKRFILTCRTTILNQARQESDRIEQSKIELSQHEVKIEDYRDLDKAKILYNHIYFSSLTEDLKDVFFRDQFYWKVIKHKFYNPRIVEFFTDPERLQPEIEYSKEVLSFLNDPSKIWEKPFTVQLSAESRLFLSSLYALGGKYSVSEKYLKEVFDARLDYEVTNNNYTKRSSIFNKVVKELLGGWIIRTLSENAEGPSQINYRFLNPSIEDFLTNYFNRELDEYCIVLHSAVYFDQFESRICTAKSKTDNRILFGSRAAYLKLLELFKEKSPELKTRLTNNKGLATVTILTRLFEWVDIKDVVIDTMNKWSTAARFGWHDRENIIEMLSYIAENELMDQFEFSPMDILVELSSNMPSYYQIESLSQLISKHESYKAIIENGKAGQTEAYGKMQRNIDSSWARFYNDFISSSDEVSTTIDKDDLIEAVNIKMEQAQKMNIMLGLEISPVIQSYSYDYDDRLEKNRLISSAEETRLTNFQDDFNVANEVQEINRLFNCTDEIEELPF
jgi:energy-coupling factor transporter ATP-binding protein EcfA2